MNSNSSPKIRLDGSLGLRDAESVKQRLADGLGVGTSVHVDCSGLTEVDASIIQLMIAAQKSFTARGLDYTVSMPTDGVLAQALRRGGFLPRVGSDPGPMMSFGVNV